MKKQTVYFSLGSNLGDREGNIRKALQIMEEQIGEKVRQSALIETAPWGFDSANAFINAAACFLTPLAPQEILLRTKSIERRLGRTRKSVNSEYHDRIIDIDILLYGHEEIEQPALRIPHPLMLQRDFVMVPLAEIISDDDMEWLKNNENCV